MFWWTRRSGLVRPFPGGGRAAFSGAREEEDPGETLLAVGCFHRDRADHRPGDAQIRQIAVGERFQLIQGLAIDPVALALVAELLDKGAKAMGKPELTAACYVCKSHLVASSFHLAGDLSVTVGANMR